ncbi:MAG: hypothetical protein LBT54_06920, partial [Bifidobacteriaceae bacterium]|nr:hypothetical protein [Bifidobacteriaceae bacterium]
MTTALSHEAPALSGVVHVLSAPPREAPRLRGTLAEWELERAAALDDAGARARSIVSAALARHGAAMLTGNAPSLIDVGRWCRTCATVGDHGRPVVFDAAGMTMTNVHLSTAAAGGLVVAAASASGPVGIDIEPEDGA